MTTKGTLLDNENGRIFREAWIAGVTKHYPGEPKPGYITPWDDTPDWERQAAAQLPDWMLYSQPFAHMIVGALGGWLGKFIWKPTPM